MQHQRKSIAILDANAFISMSSLADLATKTRIMTTQDVLLELKDQKTIQFVQSFPFKIQTIDCDEKVLNVVKDFAKKTGDIGSLSQVDMELIAAAFIVYQRQGLDNLIRKEPPPIQEKQDLLDIAEGEELSQSSYSDQEQTKIEVGTEKISQVKEQKQQQHKKQEDEQKQQEDDGWIVVPSKPKRKQSQQQSDEDDEQGWVTSKNYQKKMAEITSSFKEEIQQEQQQFNVWLISADFAIQNVAVQMGIKLKSLDGRKISTIRRFVYECYLCWKKYRIHDQKVRLCKNCGYNSLSKIAYSIDSKGNMILHRKKGWKPNMKILQIKERKYQEQQRKKKHQHARRKKKPSIFDH